MQLLSGGGANLSFLFFWWSILISLLCNVALIADVTKPVLKSRGEKIWAKLSIVMIVAEVQSRFHVELKWQTCMFPPSELLINRDAAFSVAAVTQTSDMQTARLQHQIWSQLALSNQIPTFCSSKRVQWKDLKIASSCLSPCHPPRELIPAWVYKSCAADNSVSESI